MNLVRTEDSFFGIEWQLWITRTQREDLEGREAEIAEEAYQQGLQEDK